jgi:glycogen debranching enzyme
MAYYGSVDSTPLFLRTLDRYCAKYGRKLLERSVTLRSGEIMKLSEVVDRARGWIMYKLDKSKSGLLEFKKVNPHGISNQVWKDSEEFYVHENGHRANHSRPIASIEIQGLVYDALMACARLLPEKSEECIKTAKKVRTKTLDLLWMPERKYFVLGYDYDDKGKLRLITTKTANPAALLDTGIFDDLEEAEKKRFIKALIENITSSDFLTDAGIRSRALSEAKLVNHWDYHGSYVSWPKETYDIAKGLRRQGFPKLARQFENRILNVCLKYRAYPEFVYVDDHGRVLASAPSGHSHGELILVDGTNQPERIQAWTVSAVTAIISSRFKQKLSPIAKKVLRNSWQKEFESKILKQIPIVNRHFNPFALAAKYPTYHYKVAGK